MPKVYIQKIYISTLRGRGHVLWQGDILSHEHTRRQFVHSGLEGAQGVGEAQARNPQPRSICVAQGIEKGYVVQIPELRQKMSAYINLISL